MNLTEQKKRAAVLRAEIKTHENTIEILAVELEPLEQTIASAACGFGVGDVIEWCKMIAKIFRYSLDGEVVTVTTEKETSRFNVPAVVRATLESRGKMDRDGVLALAAACEVLLRQVASREITIARQLVKEKIYRDALRDLARDHQTLVEQEYAGTGDLFDQKMISVHAGVTALNLPQGAK